MSASSLGFELKLSIESLQLWSDDAILQLWYAVANGNMKELLRCLEGQNRLGSGGLDPVRYRRLTCRVRNKYNSSVN